MNTTDLTQQASSSSFPSLGIRNYPHRLVDNPDEAAAVGVNLDAENSEAPGIISYPIPSGRDAMYDSVFSELISAENTDLDENQVPTASPDITLTMSAFRSLRQGEFLDEEIIAAFLQFLVASSNSHRTSAFTFEPQFFRNVLRRNSARISDGSLAGAG